MKAKINGIEFEGTPEEFNRLLISEKSIESKSSVPLKLNSSKIKKVYQTKAHGKQDAQKNISTSIEFITALFRYKPSKNRNRQGYVLQLLSDGKNYTIRNLASRANTDSGSVVSAIRRAVSAGCVIQVNNRGSVTPDDLNEDTKVRLVSFGTIERALQVKEELKIQNAQPKKDKKTQTVISTGSAPITKILYNESN